MLIRLCVITLLLFSVSCSPPPRYAWQDMRTPAREDVTADLEVCRAFAARQYRPGIPAGEAYLKNQREDADVFEHTLTGEWRPDRDPHKSVNVTALPRHDVPVAYTGYPGELDYYPDYLDDILEKCMGDRGWEYSEVKENP